MGADKVRLPDDVRDLARTAANFEGARPMLKDSLIEAVRAGRLKSLQPIRRNLPDALKAEGWKRGDAKRLADEVMGEAHPMKRKWRRPAVGRGGRYASDRVQREFDVRLEELKHACDGAPLWKRVLILFIVRPLVFIVGFVVSLIVGILDPTDWRGAGSGGG